MKTENEFLDQARDGHLNDLRLLDPVDGTNDLIADVDVRARQSLVDAAERVLRAIQNDTWSPLFDDGAPPPPAVNVGGRTLG